MKSCKSRYKVTVTEVHYGVYGTFERLYGKFETFAVSEAQAINNVCWKYGINRYGYDIGRDESVDYEFKGEII